MSFMTLELHLGRAVKLAARIECLYLYLPQVCSFVSRLLMYFELDHTRIFCMRRAGAQFGTHLINFFFISLYEL